ncbi:MAG TPA: Zn-ribbon domain-containing OB-fold protein [Acidimicrobiales bacterium]|nr:Zn-ribbon domain-containing OB-fold protein [Acidimicrobiales bacterium]
MSGLTLPPALRDVEPMRSIRAPARLEYTFTAGQATSRFLRGMAERRILGERCGVCGKVMLPPRGSCPTDGVPTSEQVDLADRGIVTTFCVVNVKFSGSAMELPYVCATVLPDGADMGLFGMVQEVPSDQIRMGMRVEAVWDDEPGPSLASIKWWRPTGEPDAPYESYREHV